jgi:hypothetical protein
VKVINKRPSYIKNSERLKNINQAYMIVFRAINKIDSGISRTANNGVKQTK